MTSYQFGRRLVELHDQEGLSLDLTLEMAKENKLSVSLFGILIEAAQRKWPERLVKEMARKWAKYNHPTETETKALHFLGEA